MEYPTFHLCCFVAVAVVVAVVVFVAVAVAVACFWGQERRVLLEQ